MDSKINLSVDQLTKDVHKALKAWYRNTRESHFDYLYLYHELCRQGEYNSREATNQLLIKGIADLEDKNAQYAEFLQLRFIEGKQVKQLAAQLDMGESKIYRMQKRAIRSLAESLLELEQQAKTANSNLLQKRLPAPSTSHVIGINQQLNHLSQILLKREAPWIVLLAGLGGIGKTTLADALTRHLLFQGWFTDIGWVSAKVNELNSLGHLRILRQPVLSVDQLVHSLVIQLFGDVFKESTLPYHHAFSSLERRLKEKPHLIVIDNLETVEDIRELIPTLNRLTNPSKFLLTSRFGPFDGVFHFSVPELKIEHALELIRKEASTQNISFLAQASDQELSPIYEMVGGNPLALRLIVGQAHFRALNMILNNLRNNETTQTEELYHFIYKQAWDSMNDTTRRLFLAMPLIIDEGGTLDQIAYITQLDPVHLDDSLQQLISMNLVDVRPTLKDVRYSIHNLTRTFLEKGPAQWA